MDGNLKVSLSLITNTLNTHAKRAGTRTEKHQLFEIVDGLGTAIAKQNGPISSQGSAPGGQNAGFNAETFMTECGVDPNWATIAA